MKNKIKGFLNTKKGKFMSLTAMLTLAMSTTAFAAETVPEYGTQISTAMVSSVTTIVSNTVSMVAAILPIALTILGVYTTVKMGLKFVKTTVG